MLAKKPPLVVVGGAAGASLRSIEWRVRGVATLASARSLSGGHCLFVRLVAPPSSSGCIAAILWRCK